MIAKMPAAETANIEKTAFSRKVRRVFGLDLHSWEQLMLSALGIAGLVAIAVFVTTASVVILQREENARTKDEFERYKLEAGEKIATANADAADANRKAEEERTERLKLEAQIQPRSLTLEQQEAIGTALRQFAGHRVDVISYALDVESVSVGRQILAALRLAMIVPGDSIASQSVAGTISTGVHVAGANAPLANAIRDALGRFGNLSPGPIIRSGGGGMVGMSAGPPPGPPAEASIFVGIKPIATIK
jgi:hypothetical protein